MKKLLSLVAMLTIGAWIAGCGEPAPATKPATPPATTGPAATGDEKPAGSTDTKPAADGDEKPAGAADTKPAADGDEKPEEKKPE